MTDEQTPRQKYQAALERHTQIKIAAAAQFSALREVSDEQRQLATSRRDAEAELRRLENDPSNKALRDNALRWEVAGRVEAARLEVESIAALAKIVAQLETDHAERARALAGQRDSTAALIAKMKRELLLLEMAERKADRTNKDQNYAN